MIYFMTHEQAKLNLIVHFHIHLFFFLFLCACVLEDKIIQTMFLS